MKSLLLLLKTKFLLILLLGLLSCSNDINHYQDTTPVLDIQSYFTGPVIAWGIVQDYNLKVTRRFCVELEGSWQQEQGLLKEVFYFKDGEVSRRNWRLTRQGGGKYLGQAEDVIGIAGGQQLGYAFRWQYRLAIDIDGESYHFDLDDWMYRIDDHRVFNKTQMKKFGITLAEITLFFDKEQPLRHC
ncbi:DUF3833 domain-containing protein [Thalassomonas actiniarum]|uniref:DUF3833 domain-containing protein n=1 Tax=Thalassomonas actiniarum TaxID=485447 RepID=A0AAF0C2L0_9GAMM|nr:DUF3833 domain-containing protein [Thalassomonas actiniarum]WDE00267.1 DUF3833 domain-containing protein [Thalassomonas actiniarum]